MKSPAVEYERGNFMFDSLMCGGRMAGSQSRTADQAKL